MRHRAGLTAWLALVVLGTGNVDTQEGTEQEDEDFIVNVKERAAHEHMKAAAAFPAESKQHLRALEEVESDLVKLYDHGRGNLHVRSLILLGDLVQQRVSKTNWENITEHQDSVDIQDMINQAGIYYEDAFEKHNSTQAYFKLGKVVESLGTMQGTAGNMSGKELLLDQANKMFLVCAAHGHLEAMRCLCANCEENRGFGADGCPHSVQTQARQLNEELLKESPSDPLLLGKLAIFWAQGFGVPKPDLPKACWFAGQAAEANVAILATMPGQGRLEDLKDKDYDELGYNTNNYILHGNCKYFNNFQSPGDSSDRSKGREILMSGMRTRHLGREAFKRLQDHLISMIGPDEEPTYSGHITWHDALHDDLGDTWYVYIWVSHSKGFFWSPRLRLGDVALRVNLRGDLVDFSGDNPHFWLEAEKFLASDDHKHGQLWGKARRQTGEDSFMEGNFTFTLMSQAPHTEL